MFWIGWIFTSHFTQTLKQTKDSLPTKSPVSWKSGWKSDPIEKFLVRFEIITQKNSQIRTWSRWALLLIDASIISLCM